ncbi:MAG: hypothetical protein ACOC56_01310 [Atribacterota bacterium]
MVEKQRLQRQRLQKLDIKERQKTPQERLEGAREEKRAEIKKDIEKKRKEQAKKLDEEFKNLKNVDIKDVKQRYKKLPEKIREKMSFSPKQLDEKQKNTISKVDERIKKVEKRYDKTKDERQKADKEDDYRRARREEEGYEAERNKLEELRNELEKGQLLDYDTISKTGARVRRAKERGEDAEIRAKQRKKERSKKIAEQLKKGRGEVTYINRQTGEVEVDGKKVDLRPEDVEDLELTSVRKAGEKKKADKIKKAAKTDKTVKELKKEGFSMDDIAEIGKIKERERLLEKSKTRELTDKELEKLGFSKKQIENIEKGKTVGELKKEGLSQKEIADIGRIQSRRKQLDKIKKEKVDSLIKENRELYTSLNKTQQKKVDGMLREGPKRDVHEKFVDYLQELRLEAQKDREYAKTSLLGMGAVAVQFPRTAGDALVESIVGTYKGLKKANEYVLNPKARKEINKQIVDTVKNTNKEQLKKSIFDHGGNIGERLKRGDPEAVSNAIIALTPVRIPASAGKFVGSLLKQDKDVAYSKSDFEVRQDLLKGSGTVKIKEKGVTQGNKDFTSVATLSMQPRQKSIRGEIKTTIDGKTKTKKVNLKDEGARFIDRKTGIAIPKNPKKLDNIDVRVTQERKGLSNKKNLLNRKAEGVVVFGEKGKAETRAVGTPKGISEAKSKKEVEFEEFIGSKEGKPYREFRSKKKNRDVTSTALKKQPKDRTPEQWDKLTKFLESVDFDKDVIEGFDRRTWMARLLGMNRNEINKAIKRFDKDVKEGWILKTGKSRATGSFETIKPVKFTLGPSFLFKNPKSDYIERLEFDKKGKLKTPQTINLPDINAVLRIPDKPKGFKIPAGLFANAAAFGLEDKYKFKNLTKQQKESELKKQPTRKQISNVQRRIQKAKNIKTQQKKGVKTPKKAKKTATPKKPQSPKTKKTGVNKPILGTRGGRKIINPELTLPKNPKTTKKAKRGYIVRIKNRLNGRKITAETNKPLPLKKASNLARKYLKDESSKDEKAYVLKLSSGTNIVDDENVKFKDQFEGTIKRASLK